MIWKGRLFFISLSADGFGYFKNFKSAQPYSKSQVTFSRAIWISSQSLSVLLLSKAVSQSLHKESKSWTLLCCRFSRQTSSISGQKSLSKLIPEIKIEASRLTIFGNFRGCWNNIIRLMNSWIICLGFISLFLVNICLNIWL